MPVACMPSFFRSGRNTFAANSTVRPPGEEMTNLGLAEGLSRTTQPAIALPKSWSTLNCICRVCCWINLEIHSANQFTDNGGLPQETASILVQI